jgi:hypothetical protein
MKSYCTFLLLLTYCFVYGQRNNVSFWHYLEDYPVLTYQDFVEKDVKKFRAYSYKLKKNGKLKKDSLLLSLQELDKENRKVYGTHSYMMVVTHGASYMASNKFENYYNSRNKITKHIDKPTEFEKKKKDGVLGYETYENEKIYEYDYADRLIKETNNHIVHNYSIVLETNDTIHYHRIDGSTINDYVYNNWGRKIESYFTLDSTRYLKTNSYTPDASSVKCSNCLPRRLNSGEKYSVDGALEESISYTREGTIHSKTNYYYDTNHNRIKQIDSTGWYLKSVSNNQPSLQAIIYFKYKDTMLIEQLKVVGDTETLEIFDENGNLVKRCMTNKNTQNCDTYIYNFEKDKIMSIIAKANINNKTEVYFTYNSKGFLIEKRILLNNCVTKFFRYYYD